MDNPVEIQEIRKKYNKVIYVDIDSTICHCPNDNIKFVPDYKDCKPFLDRIQKINELYDQNNYILYWTARGTCTGYDWTELTTKQLKEWGCKYHKLILKKPFYDLFIDDKNIHCDAYFKATIL